MPQFPLLTEDAPRDRSNRLLGGTTFTTASALPIHGISQAYFCSAAAKGDRIGFAMNGLAIIAMANVLRYRFAGQLHLDGTAITSNSRDCHRSISALPRRLIIN
jgi:hypothetical protein